MYFWIHSSNKESGETWDSPSVNKLKVEDHLQNHDFSQFFENCFVTYSEVKFSVENDSEVQFVKKAS